MTIRPPLAGTMSQIMHESDSLNGYEKTRNVSRKIAIKHQTFRLPLLILLITLVGFVVCTEEYPWYEQIIRQEVLMSNCESLQLTKNYSKPTREQLDHILVDHKHKLLYCYVPKVACTNWKRILMVLTGRYNTSDLSIIPASLVHANGSLPRLSDYGEWEARKYFESYTTLLVARHPFERLLSAYRNKLEDQLPSAKYFQARVGRYIVKKYRSGASEKSLLLGDDVTFREFVQYLVDEGAKDNEHWQPIYDMCHPCTLPYSFIAKYERLLEDAEILLHMIRAPYVQFPAARPAQTYQRLRLYLAQLSLDEIYQLYQLYRYDFQLFGYDLQDILGYDLG